MNSLLSSLLYDNNDFYKAFEKDMKNAQHSILIESPLITTRRMNESLILLRILRQRGVSIVVNTHNHLVVATQLSLWEHVRVHRETPDLLLSLP